MGGYGRNEYENWDEYEEDCEEQEVEETHQPTQEELKYLALRHKLKEAFRMRMKKELGTANVSSRDKINGVRKDNYGSFFGPSQPVISARVIQESKSLLENPDLAYKISNPNRSISKSAVSCPVKSKSGDIHPPRVTNTNTLKRKAECLKNTRDYSFLLSDDNEVPASSKSLPPPRNVSAPKTGNSYRVFGGLQDSRPTQQLNRSSNERKVVNDSRRPIPPHISQNKHKAPSSNETRKQLGSNHGNGPGRPKGIVPCKTSAAATTGSNIVKTNANRLAPSSALRRQAPLLSQSSSHKPIPSRGGQPSGLRKPLVQKDYIESRNKLKVVTKQAAPSFRDQSKLPPPKQSAHHSLSAVKPKRQLRDEASDDEDPLSQIRKMFRYNPDRYQDDDDVSDMEANYEDIMREERRSAKLARKEDDEQLQLIEEEEKRERMRQAKKRKSGH